MKRLFVPLVVAVALGGCEIDTAPAGLRRTPPGDGPVVRFERERQLPDVPLPNDVLTFPDPTSRTGLRLDLGVSAPTAIERRARQDLTEMEGWGVSAPITVAFHRSPGASPLEPAIDLDAVLSRMADDEHDPADDPVYVVNLTTGIPVLLDVGSGYHPVTLRDPSRFGPLDPKATEGNLLFETSDEAPGLREGAYRPDLDRDVDGVLDHPNTLIGSNATRPGGPAAPLLDWYERQTDTLILRPIVPLDEMTEYAVVLTDRLKGPNGQPVRSPFEAIHHPSQVAGVTRLRDWLTDPRLASYFGDIAGTGLEHVAFAWTFTTQPTHTDMRVLRDGLHGRGPLSRLQRDFPAELVAARAVGPNATGEQPAGWETSTDACKQRAGAPFVLRPDDPALREPLRVLFRDALGLDARGVAALEAAYAHVSHVVVGSMRAPFLMGDPASPDPGARFSLDLRTGAGDVRADEVHWVLVVPKAKGDRRQPFPVAVWSHAMGSHAAEALLFAADYARQGVAMIGYDAPGHGLVVGPTQLASAQDLLAQSCLAPFVSGLTRGRARDVDGDGVPDSGGAWWTAGLAHTRDNVRQTVLDAMQLVRGLRSFDGRTGAQDTNGDGQPDLAGDFDGDGVPDVGGPNASYFAAGRSLGGVVSQILGGVEPSLVATAPIAGGAGLVSDVALRSDGLVPVVTAQLMGPWVFAVPATERPANDDAERSGRVPSSCTPAQRSVRIQANDGVRDRELEIACLEPAELAGGMTVVVTNVTAGQVRCARTDVDGRFAVAIPTTTGDKLDVQLYTAPDVVASYATCQTVEGAPVGRRISTLREDAPLLAPADGLGLRRQSPELRRFRDLAQAALDPADPIAFAPFYMLKSLVDDAGARALPRALLAIQTVGDAVVPIAAGLSFARAAGAVPFLPPSAVERLPAYADYATPREIYERLGRRTPMRFLAETGVVTGLARLGRTSAGPACQANHRADAEACSPPVTIDPSACRTALYDPDWASEGRQLYDQPHPDVPLRLARVAAVRVTDSTSLARAWEPRLRGVPFGPDDAGWSATERVVGAFSHYVAPEGAHAWGGGDACRAFDHARYGNALVAAFFASGGRDVYYLSHPKTHTCLADETCAFLQ